VQVFFSDQDPVAEAEALIRHLQAWLDEQPEQGLRPATANFRYGADGSLRTLNIILLDDEE
jgi:hypothetical protein